MRYSLQRRDLPPTHPPTHPYPLLQGPFLPGYESVEGPAVSYGLQRLDHAVSNVHALLPAVRYLAGATGGVGGGGGSVTMPRGNG